MQYVKLFFIALPIFVFLDLTWLGLIMGKFYQDQLGSIGRYSKGSLHPNWTSAVLAYVFLVAGVAFFVVPPFAGKEIGLQVLLWGGLFGLVVYGVYELTNHAIIANWPVTLVFVDTLWGVFLYAAVSFLTAYFARALGII